MCDDYFDDFDGDSDEYFEGEDFDFHNEETQNHDHEIDENPEESGCEPCKGFPQWQDWMIIGPLSEDIAREKMEKEKLERGLSDEDDI